MRGKRRAMLSVEKCRQILQANEDVTDKEIREFEIKLYAIAELLIDAEEENL